MLEASEEQRPQVQLAQHDAKHDAAHIRPDRCKSLSHSSALNNRERERDYQRERKGRWGSGLVGTW